MRLRTLRHPNVWLPIVAIAPALWAYMLIGLRLLARIRQSSEWLSRHAGEPVRVVHNHDYALLILALAVAASYGGMQLSLYRVYRRKGLLVALLVPVVSTLGGTLSAIWRGVDERNLDYVLAQWGVSLVGLIAASILVYLSYRKSVPSPFDLAVSSMPAARDMRGNLTEASRY